MDANDATAGPVRQPRVVRGPDRVGPVWVAAAAELEDLANPEVSRRCWRARLAHADWIVEAQLALVESLDPPRAEADLEQPARDAEFPERFARDPADATVRSPGYAHAHPHIAVGVGEARQQQVDLGIAVLGRQAGARDRARLRQRLCADAHFRHRVGPRGQRTL